MITQSAVSYGIAMASEQEIDEINILQATFLAMQRALDKLAVKPDLALLVMHLASLMKTLQFASRFLLPVSYYI